MYSFQAWNVENQIWMFEMMVFPSMNCIKYDPWDLFLTSMSSVQYGLSLVYWLSLTWVYCYAPVCSALLIHRFIWACHVAGCICCFCAHLEAVAVATVTFIRRLKPREWNMRAIYSVQKNHWWAVQSRSHCLIISDMWTITELRMEGFMLDSYLNFKWKPRPCPCGRGEHKKFWGIVWFETGCAHCTDWNKLSTKRKVPNHISKD